MTGSQNMLAQEVKNMFNGSTGMITKELNANGLTIKLRRYGKICVVTCNTGALTRDIAVGSKIAQLPTEFRPHGWLPFPDQATGLNDTTPTAGAYYAISSNDAGLTANKLMKKGAYIRFVVAYTALI